MKIFIVDTDTPVHGGALSFVVRAKNEESAIKLVREEGYAPFIGELTATELRTDIDEEYIFLENVWED